MRRWREEDREPVITTLYKASLLPSSDRRRSGHHIRFTVLSSISLRGSRAGHSCKAPSIFAFFSLAVFLGIFPEPVSVCESWLIHGGL